MPEEIQVIEAPVTSLFGTEVAPENVVPVETIITNPLGQQEQPNPTEQVKAETPEPNKVDTPTVDYNIYVKEQFGFDSVEVAKEQIAKWKDMKPHEEPKFANDESRVLFEAIKDGKKTEVLTLLAKQQALENITSGDVTETNALDIVKLAMMQKYPSLSKEQIDYKYNKQFAVPSKPVQSSEEMDEDFQQRTELWQRQVTDIKQDLMIEANISKPELEKAKAELKLTDIFKYAETKVPPTQEEIEKNEAIVNSQIGKLGEVLKEFKGVDIKAINGKVELPLSYVPNDSERTQLQTVLTKAIKDNDVNGFFADRWYDKEGNPNQNQMIEDLNWMLNGKSVAQKMANEAAAQMVEAKAKEASNIHLNTQSPQGTVTVQNPLEQPTAGKMPEIMMW